MKFAEFKKLMLEAHEGDQLYRELAVISKIYDTVNSPNLTPAEVDKYRTVFWAALEEGKKEGKRELAEEVLRTMFCVQPRRGAKYSCL
ncbi:MAG: hypothetical protein HY606_11955 [Planctomycetes bacterium]|nr:hypothetical protein [Planctomycetota bacterium]